MGLAIDNTPGGASSTAYVSLATCSLFIEENVHITDTWSALSTSNRTACVIYATNILDSEIAWIGTRGSTTQALRWPRDSAVDPDGNSIDNSIIPLAIQRGTAFFSYSLSQDDRIAESDTYGFKQLEAGSLNMVIDKYDRKPVMPTVVWDLLKFYGTKLNSATRVLERR